MAWFNCVLSLLKYWDASELAVDNAGDAARRRIAQLHQQTDLASVPQAARFAAACSLSICRALMRDAA